MVEAEEADAGPRVLVLADGLLLGAEDFDPAGPAVVVPHAAYVARLARLVELPKSGTIQRVRRVAAK